MGDGTVTGDFFADPYVKVEVSTSGGLSAVTDDDLSAIFYPIIGGSAAARLWRFEAPEIGVPARGDETFSFTAAGNDGDGWYRNFVDFGTALTPSSIIGYDEFANTLRFTDLSTSRSGPIEFALIAERTVQLLDGYRTSFMSLGLTGYGGGTGTATYAGSTVGLYRDASGVIDRVRGDLDLVANFGTGGITGSATRFFRGDLNPVLAPELSFDFTATRNSLIVATASNSQFTGHATSQAGGLGLTGNVLLTILGDSQRVRDEVAIAYTLGQPGTVLGGAGPYLAGIGVAGNVTETGVPPPPPPPPLPPNNTEYYGPSTLTKLNGVLGDNKGGTTFVDGPDPQIAVRINTKGTADISDDTYRLRYFAHDYYMDDFYATLSATTDPLGPSRRGVYGEANMFVFDVSTALSGALDYATVIGFTKLDVAPQEFGFMIQGDPTPTASMPTTGSASYAGGTRGLLFTGGKIYSTASEIAMAANFGTGAVSGQTSNFRYVDAATGTLVTPGFDANFAFTATIDDATFTGVAQSAIGGLGLTGHVEGEFLGPAAAEAGLVYALGSPNNGTYMSGGGALGKQ